MATEKVQSYITVTLSTNQAFSRTYPVYIVPPVASKLTLAARTGAKYGFTTFQEFGFQLPSEGTYYLFKSKHFDVQVSVKNIQGVEGPCIVLVALRYVNMGFIYNVVGNRLGSIGSTLPNELGFSYGKDNNGNGVSWCTAKFKDGSTFSIIQTSPDAFFSIHVDGAVFNAMANMGGLVNQYRYADPGKLYLRDGSSIEQNAANVPIFAKSWLVPENEMMLNERFFPSTLTILAENSCQLFKQVSGLEPLPPYVPEGTPLINDIVSLGSNSTDEELIEFSPSILYYTDEVQSANIGSGSFLSIPPFEEAQHRLCYCKFQKQI